MKDTKTTEENPFDACPDGGRCWHGCTLTEEGKGKPCWRVGACAPMTAYGETWPDEVKREHGVEVPERPEPTVTREQFATARAEHAMLWAHARGLWECAYRCTCGQDVEGEGPLDLLMGRHLEDALWGPRP